MAKSAREQAEELWAKDQKAQKRENAPDHVELRDRWLELYPNMTYSGGDWHRYGEGYWQTVPAEEVEGQILHVLEASQSEGVKVTGHLIGSVLRLCKATKFVSPEVWDADPNIIVLTNGTLEIQEGRLREHRPEDYARHSLPYGYDPDAEPEVFLEILRQAVPESMNFLQEFAGYCLTPDTAYELALWMKGPRGCGKSTVIEGLAAMLGAKHGVLGLAEIESSPFALAKIPGKTLLSSTEQPASFLKSTHVIDALISGETITVDRKYREAEYVKPVAKVVWAMNDLPRIGNTTSGIFRRVQVLPFPPRQGEADPSFKEFVKGEGAGILNWALEGLRKLQEREKFVIPETMQEATREFEQSNDLPAMFVEEHCLTGAGKEVSASLLYSNYAQWAKDNGHHPQSSSRVAEDWKRLGFERVNRKGRKFWKGVEMKGAVSE